MNPGMMAMMAKKKAPMAKKPTKAAAMPMKKGGTAKKATKKMTMGGKAC
jgi:hypothetical protein